MTVDDKPVFVWNAFGANRIEHTDTDRITEAFEKDHAPTPGSIGIAIQARDELSSDPTVVGLVIVHGVGGIASGAVRASLRPIYRLHHPIDVSGLNATISGQPIDVPLPFYPEVLDPTRSSAVIAALTDHDPGVTDWLTRITTPPVEFSESVEQARAETRDSINLAAQMADIELPADALIADDVVTSDDDLLDSVINSAYEVDLEEEMLPVDLTRFRKNLKATPAAASMSVFRDRKGRNVLSVFSVNKKPLEEEMGVDLFYWDQINDVFTFIQYKRLEKATASHGWEWAYKRKTEIAKQLKLMPKLLRDGPTETSGDWRMTDTPFWFKFVKGNAGAEPGQKVLKGMYVSADWMRLAIEEQTLLTGPKGGFRVTYDNTKYISRNAFTHLVLKGLLGTTSQHSKSFKKVLKSLGKDREVIIAVRNDWVAPVAPSTWQTSEDPDLPF